MDGNEKRFLSSLVRDDSESLITLLELNNITDFRPSLATLDVPPILQNSPPLISIAIYLNSKKCISSLLVYKSNLNIRDSKGRTPIHFAVAFNQIETLELLEREGANMLSVDDKGRNILHYASCFDNLALFQWIIAKHFELNNNDNQLFTPLHFAVESRDLNFVNYLLANNIIKQTPNINGWTPILLAAKHDQTEILETLILYGGDWKLCNDF